MAELVIHESWAGHAKFETQYHRRFSGGLMTYSKSYWENLHERLKAKFRNRKITRTYSRYVLDEIWHDTDRGKSPFKSFSQLYSDHIHLRNEVGGYLMHNLMRVALRQKMKSDGFKLDKRTISYLDSKIEKVLNLRPK